MAVGQEHHVNNPFTAEEIERALYALVAWAGNASATSRFLKSEKGLDISPGTLNSWKRTHGVRLNEIREKHSSEMEATLTHEMRETAALAVEATKLAVEKTRDGLESGAEKDPARAAANLSKVASSSTDKLLSLTGRPTQITENRDVGAIIRSLAARGVLQIPEVIEGDE